MGRYKSRFKDTDKDAGRFIQLPVVVLECPNYRLLSYPARALLLELAIQFRGSNNGSLLLSYAFLKKRGWTSSDVIHRAKKQLIELGFIYETVKGCRPNKASWYALTWRGIDKIDGYDPHAIGGFPRSAYMNSKKYLNPPNGAKSSSIGPHEKLETSVTAPLSGSM